MELKLVSLFVSVGCLVAVPSCADDDALPAADESIAERSGGCGNNHNLVDDVRGLIAARGITPLDKPDPIRPELVELGRQLFHDKILSGGHDVSCGTCHNPGLGLTDRRPLFAGVHGNGLGLHRQNGQVGGRHSQTLFNLHTLETLTIDGKVEEVGGNVIGLGLPVILPQYQVPFEDFPGVMSPHVIAGQAMLPEVTFAEMAGIPGVDSNDILDCLNPSLPLPVVFGCMFDAYMARLGAIPEYVDLFEEAYPGVDFADMNFGHAGNAIAAYEIEVFASNNSAWDQFVAGDDCALDNKELRGAKLFFDENEGNCASCHSGNAFTDNDFHQTLAPNFGCGNDLPKRNGASGYDDFGRTRNTHAVQWIFGPTGDEVFPVPERYFWRTPPLRNIEFTKPYGRLGQFAELEDFIAHYEDPVSALLDYDITNLPNTKLVDHSAFQCEHNRLHQSLLDNSAGILAAGVDPALATVNVDSKQDVNRLAAFLRALSDKDMRPGKLADEIPDTVPSGFPVDRP